MREGPSISLHLVRSSSTAGHTLTLWRTLDGGQSLLYITHCSLHYVSHIIYMQDRVSYCGGCTEDVTSLLAAHLQHTVFPDI